MNNNGQTAHAKEAHSHHEPSPLLGQHGGYRNLRSFQLAQLCYDITTRFCQRYVKSNSRTYDQMIQAARSGVQNIAEGSQASGTSKKSELKLTNVARASLEELKLDYEDFLRQRHLPQWSVHDPRRTNLGRSPLHLRRRSRSVGAGCSPRRIVHPIYKINLS